MAEGLLPSGTKSATFNPFCFRHSVKIMKGALSEAHQNRPVLCVVILQAKVKAIKRIQRVLLFPNLVPRARRRQVRSDNSGAITPVWGANALRFYSALPSRFLRVPRRHSLCSFSARQPKEVKGSSRQGAYMDIGWASLDLSGSTLRLLHSFQALPQLPPLSIAVRTTSYALLSICRLTSALIFSLCIVSASSSSLDKF